MKRKIVGFHKDEAGDWVAELDCGHGFHMRHQPPFLSRPWVLSDKGRKSRFGMQVECVRCEQDKGRDTSRDGKRPSG